METKEIFRGDSWNLPRMQWIDIDTGRKEGERGLFSVSTDVGIYLRGKGEEGEGKQFSAYLMYGDKQITIGEDGKIQMFLAGSPLYPTPRINVKINLVSIVDQKVKAVRRKKGKKDLDMSDWNPTEEEVEKFAPVLKEIIQDE